MEAQKCLDTTTMAEYPALLLIQWLLGIYDTVKLISKRKENKRTPLSLSTP